MKEGIVDNEMNFQHDDNLCNESEAPDRRRGTNGLDGLRMRICKSLRKEKHLIHSLQPLSLLVLTEQRTEARKRGSVYLIF
jgi:hypothetical protein